MRAFCPGQRDLINVMPATPCVKLLALRGARLSRVINVMNAMLTAVDCACTALMLGAAGFDEDETSTFNDIAFVLQLLALIGNSKNLAVLEPSFSRPRKRSLELSDLLSGARCL